jgi:hypothetical protein
MKRLPALAAAALTLLAVQAKAQAPLAFVTCPMLRDTATVPCWLAEYEGQLYYLGAQGEFPAEVSAPSLGRQALIEGTPTGEQRCGGRVLADVHVSIRPERDAACEAMLPAVDGIRAEAPQGTAASETRPAQTAPAAPPMLGSRKFEVLFDFDWATTGRDTDVIQEAVAYAKANPKAELRVQGYRASVRLSGGKLLEEAEGIDVQRASGVIATMQALGVETDILAIDNPIPELGDHTRRRAVIDVVLSGADDHSEH